MGVVQRLMQALKTQPAPAHEQKAAALAFVDRWQRVAWPTPSFSRLTADGYRGNAAVFACIRALAYAYPEPPMVAKQRGEKVNDGHPLQALLASPNAIMGEAELALYVITYLAVGGNCYLHKVRNNRGMVVELWPYHAGQMAPIPSQYGWVEGFEYTDGSGKPQRVEASEVVHLKWPAIDTARPWLALAPLMAIAREVDSDNEATRYMYALLVNDAVPRTILSIPEGVYLDPEQAARIKAQFNQRHGGDNRGGVSIVEGGAEITRMGLNLEELALDALRRVPETRIAAAFGVPAIVAGLSAGLERSTYANFGEARAMFTEQTLVPLWRMVASELTRDLASEFGPGLTIEHDTSKVAALQENEGDLWDRVMAGWDRDLVGRKEARRKMGWPDDLPPDDAYKSDIAAMVMLDTEPAPEPDLAPPPAATITELPLPQLADGKRRQVKAKPRAVQTETEKKIAKATRAYLQSEYAKAAEHAGESVAQMPLDTGDDVERVMRRYYPVLIEDAFDRESDALGVSIAYDLEMPEVQKTLKSLAKEVRAVADTTREEIRALVGKAAREGWSTDDLARAIRESGEINSVSRSVNIARTETASAYSQGSIAAWKESGVVEAMEWLLGPEPCEDCEPLGGKRAPLGESFDDGVEYPPRHPQCTCALVAVVSKE